MNRTNSSCTHFSLFFTTITIGTHLWPPPFFIIHLLHQGREDIGGEEETCVAKVEKEIRVSGGRRRLLNFGCFQNKTSKKNIIYISTRLDCLIWDGPCTGWQLDEQIPIKSYRTSQLRKPWWSWAWLSFATNVHRATRSLPNGIQSLGLTWEKEKREKKRIKQEKQKEKKYHQTEKKTWSLSGNEDAIYYTRKEETLFCWSAWSWITYKTICDTNA